MEYLNKLNLVRIAFVLGLLIGWKFPLFHIANCTLFGYQMYLESKSKKYNDEMVTEVRYMKDIVSKIALKNGFKV